MGFVDFPNPNTNTSKIFYYSQSLVVCFLSRNRIFSLPKWRKWTYL